MASCSGKQAPRFSLEQVVAELENDPDSGEDDLYSGSSDSESGDEIVNDNNNNNIPLPVVVTDALSQNDNLTQSDNSSSDSDSDYNPPQKQQKGTAGTSRGRGKIRVATPNRQVRGLSRVRSYRGRGRGRGGGVPLIAQWTGADDTPPNDIPFEGNPGINGDIDTSNFKPHDFLELYFNEDLINHLVTQTNLYAESYIQSAHLKRFSRVHDWENVTFTEMKKFLALVLLMGLAKLPSIEMYWSTKLLYNMPVFTVLMQRNRFQLILKFLHFNDNAGMPERTDPNYDRLYKIRPIIDHLFERFQAVYEPRKDVCVDESLLLWKGRLLFRQYIPLKRARFGIKLYLCCESDGGIQGSGGYCYRFKVYAGKEDPVDEIQHSIPNDACHLSTSEQMVVFLIAPLLEKGYNVYTDNWYTSLRLYLYLLQKKTLACGTIRANRGIPQELAEQNVQRTGDSVALKGDNKVTATKYHSTKVVHLLSTIHGHQEINVRNRRRNGMIKRPLVSAEYNRNMGGVDKQDQLIQPYDCTRKTMKWTKKLFFHFLQVSTSNAFILACKTGFGKPFLEFLELIILEWVNIVDKPVVYELEDVVRIQDRHFCALIPPNPSKERPTRICKVCTKNGISRKEVRNYCPDCPSKPALCYPECFKLYHTKFVYWQ